MAKLLSHAAERAAGLLKRHDRHVVLAESCTGGLVSAALVQVPGVSTHYCGSAVVYQLATKARWLGVSAALLHHPGPVSREVVAAMAEGVLRTTPHADLSAAVTGHLGPDAPPEQDGLVYIALAERVPGSNGEPRTVLFREEWFPDESDGRTTRIKRQFAVAERVLVTLADFLESVCA
ncbi:MAG: CinA family protein [Planctomycetaceae bacterium]